MKFKLFPVPHIIIYVFDIVNEEKDTIEQHFFLTYKGAKRFMMKYSEQLSDEGYSCNFGGEPLWFW